MRDDREIADISGVHGVIFNLNRRRAGAFTPHISALRRSLCWNYCACHRFGADLFSSSGERPVKDGRFVVNMLLTIAVGLAIWATLSRFPPNAWSRLQIIGACLLLVGFVFWTVARFQLGASLTVSAQAKKLVTRGIYSKIRNPIYVFGSCLIAGIILVIGRPLWLLVFVLIIPLQIWRAGKEASVLQSAFGDEYSRYRAGTWF
jgi:protein-S-isoprenylcysteine O-methyltransferase Ste14